jgi:hypothetical protein
MNTNETKRKYEKPSMKVYELKRHSMILCGSPLDNPSDYPDGGDPLGF